MRDFTVGPACVFFVKIWFWAVHILCSADLSSKKSALELKGDLFPCASLVTDIPFSVCPGNSELPGLLFVSLSVASVFYANSQKNPWFKQNLNTTLCEGFTALNLCWVVYCLVFANDAKVTCTLWNELLNVQKPKELYKRSSLYICSFV